MKLIPLTYVAEDLNVSLRTVQNYCRQEFLPSYQVLEKGKAYYKVDFEEYEEWKARNFQDIKNRKFNKHTRVIKDLNLKKIENLVPEWLEWCTTGMLTGKPLAKRTLEIYDYYFHSFINQLKKEGHDKPIISVDNLRKVLGSYPPESYSTKKNIYDSARSFARFLIAKNFITDKDRDKLKEIKPKRFYPPRRTVLTKNEYEKLLNHIETTPRKPYEKIFTKTLVMFIVNTGLRASELANLKRKDVDIENGLVHVWLGKGNKNRKVGLGKEIREQLLCYEVNRELRFPDTECKNYFINYYGTALDPDVLGKKLNRLSKSCGIEFSAHGLRRTFATLWSKTHKPLNHLRIALGHADLDTTQSYIMTTEDEVVEAMKEW